MDDRNARKVLTNSFSSFLSVPSSSVPCSMHEEELPWSITNTPNPLSHLLRYYAGPEKVRAFPIVLAVYAFWTVCLGCLSSFHSLEIVFLSMIPFFRTELIFLDGPR